MTKAEKSAFEKLKTEWVSVSEGNRAAEAQIEEVSGTIGGGDHLPFKKSDGKALDKLKRERGEASEPAREAAPASRLAEVLRRTPTLDEEIAFLMGQIEAKNEEIAFLKSEM